MSRDLVSGRRTGWQPPKGIHQVDEPIDQILTKGWELSTIAAQRAYEQYYGQWYALEGVVKDLEQASPDSVFVNLDGDKENLIVLIVISQESFSRASHLDRGYRVKVIGRISKIGRIDRWGELVLKDGEILEMTSDGGQ